MRVLFSVVLFSLCAALTLAQTPIPNRPDGYASPAGGSADAPVILDAFIDLLCPDSKAAWPTIKSVITSYAGQVRLVAHLFPLPYHTWSFIANQGTLVVAAQSNNNLTEVYRYIDFLFETQDMYSNAVTAGQGSSAVISALGAAAGKAGFGTSSTFIAGINDANINWAQRVSWKYACSRAVTGTPTFLLNGVFVNAQTTWSVADWKSVIDSLLAPALARKPRFTLDPPTCASGQALCEYLPSQYQCCTAGEMCIKNVGCRC